MDVIKHMCSVIPDGLTGRAIANGLTFAFAAAIENAIISADFTDVEIEHMRPRPVSCPECGSRTTEMYEGEMSDLVTLLEPFSTVDNWDSLTNRDGEKYSKLARNMVSLPSGLPGLCSSPEVEGGYTVPILNIAALPIGSSPGFLKVRERVESIIRFAKDKYPRYYHIEKDPAGVLLKVFRNENGEKKYNRVSGCSDSGVPYPLN